MTPPAFEIAWSRLLKEFADVGLTDRLAEVCLSQPVRRQTMRIFSQIACGLRMELSACSEKVSAPKTERADAGQLQWRGASLRAHRALLHSRNVSLGKFSRA